MSKFPLLVLAALTGIGTVVQAAPSFTSSVFAAAPAGSSGPDSVAIGAGSVWISYDGGSLSSDGSRPRDSAPWPDTA